MVLVSLRTQHNPPYSSLLLFTWYADDRETCIIHHTQDILSPKSHFRPQFNYVNLWALHTPIPTVHSSPPHISAIAPRRHLHMTSMCTLYLWFNLSLFSGSCDFLTIQSVHLGSASDPRQILLSTPSKISMYVI